MSYNNYIGTVVWLSKAKRCGLIDTNKTKGIKFYNTNLKLKKGTKVKFELVTVIITISNKKVTKYRAINIEVI